MNSVDLKKLIVIAGPTAVGKTELAIKIAEQFQAEILSADSRQFYREMSIGTAKPSDEELGRVKHHFVNSLSVNQEYSAGDFESEALAVLEGIFKHKEFAVLVGGSGLFIKAVTEGFDDLPKADTGIREHLNAIYTEKGIVPLQEQLRDLDPDYYQKADINNPQRVIRALEVSLSTGLPFSSFRVQNKKERPFSIIKIGLNTNREFLYNRINERVDMMIKSGLVEEVRDLLPLRNLNALNTVGYSEIFEFLDHKITMLEAIEAIKQNTRRFAKRQLTWFRKDTEIKWFEPSQYPEIIDYINDLSL
ncbi:tRNA (adenosine(37)-N6)-dimethylallyltransferase MiaA [Pararcticibacter amylolyticus]|uniref:tRNA dimethylallyltransferase n=1 Tax=Pararcticibacter amylolyticus TaxID=2173175 RepID=A0A2U2PCG6_9SPHI|nr:tRNA (adenosine(37)-N6)-dimethylallyltransferase MiaA [Pararcticibacter amylolyticus]PWG79098.1 tRNA (adenosine(37)-N6)-dimethylallyltransferase MiaA [Pararcticibacter amylolyticus]